MISVMVISSVTILYEGRSQHLMLISWLFSQGMRFTDAHSSSGVCTPSRYTILTGRYHWRTRLQRGIVGLWGAPVIPTDRLTLGSLAKQHGYRTACIGKWHLGWDWPIPEEKMKYFKSTGYGGKKTWLQRMSIGRLGRKFSPSRFLEGR